MALTHDKQAPELIDLNQIRERVSINLTLYVNPSTGDDNNPGTSPSLPFLTIQAAIDALEEYDLCCGFVTISLANGTYNESNIVCGAVQVSSTLGPAGFDQFTVTIQGGPAAIVNSVSEGFRVYGSNVLWTFNGFTSQSTGTNFRAEKNTGGQVVLENSLTIATTGAGNFACIADQSSFRIQGNVIFNSPSCAGFLIGIRNSWLDISGNLTFGTGPAPTISSSLFRIDNSSARFAFGTLNNSFTGKKYDFLNGASIDTAQDLNALIPGTVDGTVSDSSSLQTQSGLQINNQIRERLTTTRDYYVRTDGSDSNDGLSNSAGGAFLTLQRAADAIAEEIDPNGQIITIRLQAGTFAGATMNNTSGSSGQIAIRGLGATTIIDGELAFQNGSNEWLIDQMTLNNTGAGSNIHLERSFAGLVDLKSLTFEDPGSVNYSVRVLGEAAYLKVENTTMTIDTGSINGWLLINGGRFEALTSPTWTFDAGSPPNFSQGFIVSNPGAGAHIDILFPVFNNSFVGRPVNLQGYSHIATAGTAVEDYPGTLTSIVEDVSCIDDEIGLIFNGKIRERLTANRTYYVRTDGSDSNTGLTNDAAGAFLTVQRAVDQVCDIDNNGFDVNLNVQAGTFAGGIELGPIIGAGQVTIEGQGATTILTHNVTRVILCDRATSGDWEIRNLNLETTTAFNLQSLASFTGKLLFGPGLTFAGTPSGNNPHISWEGGVLEAVNVTVSIESAPGGGAWLRVLDNGKVRFTNCTISFDSGGCILTPGFCTVTGSGSAIFGGAGTTFVNSYTGDEYQVRSEGFLSVNATSLPIPASSPGQLFGTNSKFNATDLYTGRNVETLTANKTLTDNESFRIQILTPSGANRDVNLPTGTVDGVQEYLVINPAGSGFDLLLKESAVTIATIVPDSQAAVVYDGTDWITI